MAYKGRDEARWVSQAGQAEFGQPNVAASLGQATASSPSLVQQRFRSVVQVAPSAARGGGLLPRLLALLERNAIDAP
jgi:hypothetical protein